MSMKHTKRKKEMGKKIDPGRVRLGKKMDRLEEYTSLKLLHQNLPRTSSWTHTDNTAYTTHENYSFRLKLYYGVDDFFIVKYIVLCRHS